MALCALCNNQYYPRFKLSGFFFLSCQRLKRHHFEMIFLLSFFIAYANNAIMRNVCCACLRTRKIRNFFVFQAFERGRKFCKMKRDDEMKEFSCHLTSSFPLARFQLWLCIFATFTLTFFSLSFISS